MGQARGKGQGHIGHPAHPLRADSATATLPEPIGLHASELSVGLQAPELSIGLHAPESIGLHAPELSIGSHAPEQLLIKHVRAPAEDLG